MSSPLPTRLEDTGDADTGIPQLPPLRVRAGLATLGGQIIVHDKDLHGECLDFSFVQYFLFCVTGQKPDQAVARVIERLWIATGYPDPRIWCNRIAGYLGSARVAPGLSLCAALSACNGTAYGFSAMQAAFRLQQRMPEPLLARQRFVASQLAAGEVLSGYGRPIHSRDERIAVALQCLVDESLVAGPQLQRAYWLHKQLQAAKGIEWNISAVWAAICLDFGFSAEQYEQFMLLMFSPGYVAAYGDQRSRKALSFLAGHQSTCAEPRDTSTPHCPR